MTILFLYFSTTSDILKGASLRTPRQRIIYDYLKGGEAISALNKMFFHEETAALRTTANDDSFLVLFNY
jgi:hypothetical protein